MGSSPQPEPDPIATLPVKYREALAGIRNVEFLASQKHQEQHWRAIREGAHPDIVGGVKPGKPQKGKPPSLVECRGFEPVFRRRMAALGVPMFAHCVVRSLEQQAKEFAEGDSKAKPGQSAHNFGCAVDFVHGTKAWSLTAQQWALVGHVGHEVALSLGLAVVWGGNDGPGDTFAWDPAHWELADWRTVRAVMQGHPSIKTVPEALAQLAAEVSW